MSLHKEALAEAQQLKEVAIQNAKNAIVESVTPTVKEMIEKMLLEGDDEEGDDDKNVLQDAAREIEQGAMAAAGVDPMAGDAPGLSLPDMEGKVTLDLDALKSDEHADVSVQTDAGEEIELTGESLQALVKLAGAGSENLGLKVLNLTEKLSKIRKDKKLLTETVAYSEKVNQLKTEVENVYSSLQEKKLPEKTKALLENRLESLYAAVNHMFVPAKLSVVEESFVRLGKRVIGVARVVNSNDLTNEAKHSLMKTYKGMLVEAVKLNDVVTDLGRISQTDEVKRVTNSISKLYKEIRKMARNVLSEQDFTLMIKGLPEETDVEALDVEVVAPEGDLEGGDLEGGDLEGDLDLDVGGDEAELDLDLDVGDEEGLEDEGMPEMDAEVDVDLPLDDEMEDELDVSGIEADISPVEDDLDMDMDGMDADMDDDMGGGDLDLDLEDEEEADMDIEEIVAEIEGMNEDGSMQPTMAQNELDELEEMEGEEEMDEGEVLEISESMLRRELKRMQSRRIDEEVSDKMIDPKADQFGGGSATKEPFRDMTDADMTTEGLKRKIQKEARMNRALKEKLDTYKRHISKLRKELAEQSLFNEKIVHANKLLQNENLTPKMRLKIINALDGAESLKEVRKTYGILVRALEKSKNKKSLSEGAKVLGSSSRPTKSGAATEAVEEGKQIAESADGKPLNEAVEPELARWSMLAGLSD